MLRLPDSMTVGQLRELEKANPDIPQYIHRLTAHSYEQWIATLYVEIDAIVRALQNDRNLLQDHSENSLNADIARQLCGRGYVAHFDKNKSGHADVSVEHAGYEWIGEGKKVNSVNNTHLKNGYDQLNRRYLPGTPNATQAALLIYSFGRDTKHVLNAWGQHLTECNDLSPGYASDINFLIDKKGFSFDCDRLHDSGSKVVIRNIGLHLHWAP